MAKAGVSSFKIEGRLKDMNYVKNVVAYYRQALDRIMEQHPEYTPASHGSITHFFTPNPSKTFHRGQTDYFLSGKRSCIAQWDTPKSTGEVVGEILSVQGKQMKAHVSVPLHNGDGLCYVAEGGFTGFRINTAQDTHAGTIITALTPLEKAAPHTSLLRNYDHQFENLLTQKTADRKLPVTWEIQPTDDAFLLTLKESARSIVVSVIIPEPHTPAQQPERMADTIRQQLAKLGDTPFVSTEIQLHHTANYFLPAARLNAARREAAQLLMEQLMNVRPNDHLRKEETHPHYAQHLSYAANVFNQKARTFYHDHGVETIAPAFEQQPTLEARLMTCKYCLRYELGICPKHHAETAFTPTLPLFLHNGKQRLQLHFDCKKCEMFITQPR